jgi:hypothetical protein
MRQGVSKEYLNGSRRNGRGYRPFPFDRFLTSRLGRLWDDVYAEVSAEFDHRSNVGRNFFRDLRWHVVTSCWIGAETGTIYATGPWSRGDCPVENEFYVHPHTGVLCWADKIERPRAEHPVDKIDVDADHFHQRIDGIWYTFTTTRWEDTDFYGRPYTRTEVSKCQLGKKELRELGVFNGSKPQFNGRCSKCGAHTFQGGGCVHAANEGFFRL